MPAFRVKILERTVLSSEMTEYVLEKPCSFRPGQYVLIHFDPHLYPFSIASSPLESTLHLHIQDSPRHPLDPDFKLYLQSTPTLDLTLPEGHAYLRDTLRPLLLIAGGSGFAPICSMLQDLKLRHLHRPIAFYWGVQHSSLFYGERWIPTWQAAFPEWTYIPVVSGEDPSWTGRTGWVHQAVLADHLDVSQYDIYVAGPFALSLAAREDFQQKAFPLSLYSDAF